MDANHIKFLGTSDEVTTCDCCGKKDLKATVALSIGDADPVYFGVVCAARALKMPAKDVRAKNKSADDAKHAAKMEADRAAHQEFMVRWSAFLAKAGTGPGIFEQIQSLGGMERAQAMFEQDNA